MRKYSMVKVMLSTTLSVIPSMTLSGTAMAEVPRVAVDIPPVHSLVARVMQGVGAPELIVQPGGSPHEYSLRPSEARTLQDADIVFWVGEALTPWLEGPLTSLANDARSIPLLETDGMIGLPLREGASFESDRQAIRDAGHETPADDRHHGLDPHAWLDPSNARLWLGVIARELASFDPLHADAYRANAAAGDAEIEALNGEIEASLAPLRGIPFIVFHDAFQYFENRFDFPAAGSITFGDASDPSPARIAAISERVAELGVSCAFAEPQFNPGLVRTVFRGAEVSIGVLDPLGADLPRGPDLYAEMLWNLAQSLVACLE